MAEETKSSTDGDSPDGDDLTELTRVLAAYDQGIGGIETELREVRRAMMNADPVPPTPARRIDDHPSYDVDFDEICILKALPEPDPDVRVSVTIVTNAFEKAYAKANRNGFAIATVVIRGLDSLSAEERESLRLRAFVCPYSHVRAVTREARVAATKIKEIVMDVSFRRSPTLLVCDEFLAVTGECLDDTKRWVPVLEKSARYPVTYDRIDKLFDDRNVGITEVAFPALNHNHCVVVMEPYHIRDSTSAMPGSMETDANMIAMVHASRSVAVFVNWRRLTPYERRKDIDQRAMAIVQEEFERYPTTTPREWRQYRFIPPWIFEQAKQESEAAPVPDRRFSPELEAARAAEAARIAQPKPVDPQFVFVPYTGRTAVGETGYDARSEKLKARIYKAVAKVESKRQRKLAKSKATLAPKAVSLLADALKEMSPEEEEAFVALLDDEELRDLILGRSSDDDSGITSAEEEEEVSMPTSGAGAGSGSGGNP